MTTEHHRLDDEFLVRHTRIEDKFIHRIGRWVVNTIAVSAIPLLIIIYKDRDEKVQRLLNLEHVATNGLQIVNYRIDKLEQKVIEAREESKQERAESKAEIKEELIRLRADIKDLTILVRNK